MDDSVKRVTLEGRLVSSDVRVGVIGLGQEASADPQGEHFVLAFPPEAAGLIQDVQKLALVHGRSVEAEIMAMLACQISSRAHEQDGPAPCRTAKTGTEVTRRRTHITNTRSRLSPFEHALRMLLD